MKQRDNPQKILLVCTDNDDPATGFAIRVKLIADSITRNGNNVVVLRLPNILKGKNSWAGTMPEKVELLELPMLPGLRLGLFIALSQLIRSIFIHIVAIWKKANIIQAENTIAGDACTFIRWSKTPIIVDIHGAVVEEAIFNRGESFRNTAALKSLAAAEKRCVEKADLIFVVAEPMLNHLKNKYPFLDVSKVKIIPVAADALFFSGSPESTLKEQLGFKPDDIVFVYSGGAQRYQCINEMLSLFSRILDHKKNAKLLILSIEKDKITSLINQSFPSLIHHTVVKSLDKANVAKHLLIADVGFLLRQEDVLNRVSCPTKFAEYAACGVSVITTQAAGHAPSYVMRFETGVVIDPSDENQAIEKILAFLPRLTLAQRELCKNMALEHLHWDQAVQEIEYNHKRLVNG